jgi:hypothetical protein
VTRLVILLALIPNCPVGQHHQIQTDGSVTCEQDDFSDAEVNPRRPELHYTRFQLRSRLEMVG